MDGLKFAAFCLLWLSQCNALAVEHRSDVLPEPGVCGIGATDRLIGGTLTMLDEFPWMAIMKYYNPEKNVSILMCGGSLINPQYVVSAAHCVEKADLSGWNLTHVRLGEWRISTDPDCDGLDECSDPVKDYEVENVIIHEKYTPQRQQHHDIALLRLSEKVKYTYNVQPICLPVQPELKALNYTGIPLIVSGWGTTETRQQSDVKLKVTVPGVALDVCNEAFNNDKNITEDQLCAGAEFNKDSCTGDSGGPLMGQYKLNGQSFQYMVGIVSYGFRVCGKAGKPGVYIRTSSYVDWIVSNLKP